jgi:uncharacterized membrane protein
MRKSLFLILLFQLFMYIAISFDITFFRQIIVFAYASFIPGFVLLKLIGITELKTVDRILFSIGLSLSFLMFFGFILSSVYGYIGFSEPLSFTPLIVSLSLLILGLSFVAFRKDLSPIPSTGNLSIDVKSVIGTAFCIVPLILSIIGAIYDYEYFLILMVVAISVLFILALTKIIPETLYPLMILTVSLSLVFHFSLITQNIRGSDINLEYFVYKSTLVSGHWAAIPATGINTVVDAMYSGCLSITVLPTIYSTLMNFNGTLFFKLFYPFIYGLVPVVLYRIYGQHLTKTDSLASALFFISGFTVFYGMQPLSVGRQIVAVFFMVLSFFILFNNRFSKEKRKILFAIFSFSVIFSHYSTAFLYLASLFFVLVILKLRHEKNDVLNFQMFSLIAIFLFSWCSLAYVSQQPLITLTDVFQKIFSNFFVDIASSSARSSDIFVSHSILNVPSLLNWTFLYLTNALIAVGIFYAIFKRGKSSLNLVFRSTVIFFAIVLFACIAVPNIAPSLQFGRFYSIALLFLAPCFVLGLHAISGSCNKIRRRLFTQQIVSGDKAVDSIKVALIIILLVGYLLTQVGFVNKVAGGSPISIPLDYDRIYASSSPISRADLSIQIHPDTDYLSVDWLLKSSSGPPVVYGDDTSVTYILHAYGLIPMENLYPILNNTTPNAGSFVYLRSLNINEHLIDSRLEYPFQIFNVTENSFFSEYPDIAYSNGQSVIMKVGNFT